MTTDLIIQTLTEDDAKDLKYWIFKDMAKIVRGKYSGTYGLEISFNDWWLHSNYTNIVSKFLYDEPVIGMKPEELGYYEIHPNWKACEEVNFIELFPKAGIYSFDPGKVVTLSVYGVIYYRKSFCRVEAANAIKRWVEENNDPLFKSGLLKIYRRGLVSGKTRLEWKHELKDILQDY